MNDHTEQRNMFDVYLYLSLIGSGNEAYNLKKLTVSFYSLIFWMSFITTNVTGSINNIRYLSEAALI